MTGSSGKAKEIELGDGLGDIAVKANGVRVEIHADGSVDAYTQGAVKVHSPANDTGKITTASPAESKIGDRQPDGTVYAGLSPDTGKAMYATPADAPLTYTFTQAQKYAGELNALGHRGHRDWRVPTKGELNVLYNNRAAIGGFDESGSRPAGWYRSSSQDGGRCAWDQRFSDGFQNYFSLKNNASSLRCVR